MIQQKKARVVINQINKNNYYLHIKMKIPKIIDLIIKRQKPNNPSFTLLYYKNDIHAIFYYVKGTIWILFKTQNIYYLNMIKEQETVHIEDHQNQEQQINKLDQSFDERYDDQIENNNHQFDDEDLQDILQEEGSSKQQMMLRFKVQQLQKICNSLSQTNRKLINKISKMEQQQEQKNNKSESDSSGFVDQYSQLNLQFTQIQQVISEYRQSLNEFQNNILSDLKSKYSSVTKLQQQVKSLKRAIQNLQIEKQEIQKVNRQFQTRNEGLLLQIQNLQKNNTWLQQRLNNKNYSNNLPNMSTRYDNSSVDDQLSSQMQAELQSIINKLVKELQYQRNIKKKLNDEIKRMSLELMESERQIMQKNRKLYTLQMKMLKNNKHSINVDLTQKFRVKPDDEKTQRIQNKSDQRVNFKNFSLMELINEQLVETITPKERRIIGIKIIELYQRKIDKQDYSIIIPESLIIHNFNHKRPDLISVRKIQIVNYEENEEEQCQEYLIWNLAFMIENIFRNQESSKEFAEITDLASEMLEKQYQNTRQDMKKLKGLLCL